MSHFSQSAPTPLWRIILYGAIAGCGVGLVSVACTHAQRIYSGLFAFAAISGFGLCLKVAQTTKNQWLRKNAQVLYLAAAGIAILLKGIDILMKYSENIKR
jgi:hypothetical protein